jgi:hypothetical protein
MNSKEMGFESRLDILHIDWDFVVLASDFGKILGRMYETN